ncbi:hypothetical protein Tco_0985281 [Tanacetum coccineum]
MVPTKRRFLDLQSDDETSSLSSLSSLSSSSSSSSVKVIPPHKKQVSTLSTKSLEIPKSLYDLIQKVAKFKESLKLNPNNRFAKRKLKHYKPCIHAAVAYHQAVDELPLTWK